MPSAWFSKDERQYKHIRDSAKERGVSAERAKEIAARTVNKGRRERGETPNRTTKGTGNPNRSLEDRTKQELMNRARQLHVAGRSHMTKAQLARAIRQHS